MAPTKNTNWLQKGIDRPPTKHSHPCIHRPLRSASTPAPSNMGIARPYRKAMALAGWSCAIRKSRKCSIVIQAKGIDRIPISGAPARNQCIVAGTSRLSVHPAHSVANPNPTGTMSTAGCQRLG